GANRVEVCRPAPRRENHRALDGGIGDDPEQPLEGEAVGAGLLLFLALAKQPLTSIEDEQDAVLPQTLSAALVPVAIELMMRIEIGEDRIDRGHRLVRIVGVPVESSFQP